MSSIKRVCVVGTGPAGAIALDALVKEQAFETIRVFERREAPGGCWLEDTKTQDVPPPSLERLARRIADKPVKPPQNLPAQVPAVKQYRFIQSSVYPTLETNIHHEVIAYSQEPIPVVKSDVSIARHGENTPFRPYRVIKSWVTSMIERNADKTSISYDTTVELVEKHGGSWIVTLRSPVPGKDEDYWWTEEFDAVIVASGHYIVPWIPSIEGLTAFHQSAPGAVIHSKEFRDKETYRGKKVVVVGASISGADIAFGLAEIAAAPLTAVVRGNYNIFFGDHAFQHPNIVRRPPISKVQTSGNGQATVFFEDGTTLEDVDHIIFGTGYSWTLPFLPQLAVKNNRVQNLYQHVFWHHDNTLCFIGAVQAGFTFKIYEWQCVLAARFLAGRCALPPLSEQIRWEEERKAIRGDGPSFAALYYKDRSDVVEHFEQLRMLAGEPTVGEDGKEIGRRLLPFEKRWMDAYYEGHEMRIQMWKDGNAKARKALEAKSMMESEKKGEAVEVQEVLETVA